MTARCLAAALLAAAPAVGAPLDAFNVDPAGTTVSGLSSGGYMAVQFHVAYSGLVKGAGVLAAGPFYCARGNVATALTDCTTPGTLNPPDVGYSIRVTGDYAARAEIDATSFLADSRVWLFSGTKDVTVYPIVVERLFDYYRHYVNPANIVFERSLPAAHAMITDDYGHPCGYSGDGNNPNDIFINNCGYDAAGRLLAHLYGALKPPGAVARRTHRGVRPGRVPAQSDLAQHESDRLRIHPLGLRRGRHLPCAHRLPRLPPAAGAHRRQVLPFQRV